MQAFTPNLENLLLDALGRDNNVGREVWKKVLLSMKGESEDISVSALAVVQYSWAIMIGDLAATRGPKFVPLDIGNMIFVYKFRGREYDLEQFKLPVLLKYLRRSYLFPNAVGAFSRGSIFHAEWFEKSQSEEGQDPEYVETGAVDREVYGMIQNLVIDCRLSQGTVKSNSSQGSPNDHLPSICIIEMLGGNTCLKELTLCFRFTTLGSSEMVNIIERCFQKFRRLRKISINIDTFGITNLRGDEESLNHCPLLFVWLSASLGFQGASKVTTNDEYRIYNSVWEAETNEWLAFNMETATTATGILKHMDDGIDLKCL